MHRITNNRNLKTKTFIYLIVCILLFSISLLHAQDTWIQTYQPFGDELVYFVEDIRICPDDGYAVIGSIWNSEFSTNDGFMMKTDSTGNMLWASIDTVDFVAGPEPSGFVVLEDGSFITVGNNFWGGSRYLLKRTPNGIIDWTVELDNDYRNESIEFTNDGNLITTGSSMDGTIHLQKFDLSGNLIWRETYLPDSFEYGSGYSVTQTLDGGYALTGIVEGTNNNDIIMIKTNEMGDSLWSWTSDGYGLNDRGNCIIETLSEEIIIGGAFSDSNNNAFGVLAKFYNNGELIFLNEYNMDNCYVFRAIIDANLDDSIIGYGKNLNGATLNAYSNNGNSLWLSSQIGDPGSGDRCFQLLEDNSFICLGRTQWGESIILTKCDSTGQVTSIDENNIISQKNELVCFPNPFNPNVTISYFLDKPSTVKIKIYNSKGQKIFKLLDKRKETGRHSVLWNANDFGSGIYFIQLIIDQQNQYVKKVSLIK